LGTARARSIAAGSIAFLSIAALPVATMTLVAPTGATARAASTSAVERLTGACADDKGVTVVVDFGAYGGVVISCAPADASTGLDALTAAGFAWEGTQQFGSFVCRIDGVPTPEVDQCVRTPPATAYWSYWHADRGGSWAYGTLGADAYDPAPGSVEGWAYGANSPPEAAPPELPAPPPPPPPTSNPPADEPEPEPEPEPEGPSPDEESDPPFEAAPSVSAPAASTPVATPPSPSTASTSPSSTRSTTTADTSATPEATGREAVRVTAADQPAGSPVGAVVGVGIAATLAVAAGVITLRRRRADQSE